MSDNTPTPDRCLGITTDGRRCGRAAGTGTTHDHLCYHHDDQTLTPTQATLLETDTTRMGVSIKAGEEVHVQFADGPRIAYSPSSVADSGDGADAQAFLDGLE
jgi:hypothetical protein